MDITNNIVTALLERMKSRNKCFSLSRPRFKKLFHVDTDYYLYDFGATLEQSLPDKYGESSLTFKYLDIFHFIADLLRLYYKPKNTNSEENEFGKLYAFTSIIGLHRCPILEKRLYLDRLLHTLLFCFPVSEEYIHKFRWRKDGIYYKSENIKTLIHDTLEKIRESENQTESAKIIEAIITETYSYLTGANTGLPFVRSETLLHYCLNPGDYIWLYRHDKGLFYTYLDAATLQPEIFSCKAFVYNFNLYVVKDETAFDELAEYSRQYKAVTDMLWRSNAILPNKVIRQYKFRPDKQ